ncbi:MAG: hypothetical protein AAFX00_07710, partial [Pseudomonadota bacterium]
NDFAATIALETEDTPRLSGEFRLAALPGGAPDAATLGRKFDLDLRGDITPLFLPSYRDFFGDDLRIGLKGQALQDGRVTLRDLTVDTASLDFGGSISIDSSGWPSFVDLEGRVAHDDGAPVLLPTAGAPVRVSQVDLKVDLDRRRSDNWLATFRVQGLDTEPTDIEAAVLRATGRLRPNDDGPAEVSGDIVANLDGIDFADPVLSETLGRRLDGTLSVVYRGDAPLRISNLAFSGPDFGVEGTATLDTQADGVDATVDLAVEAQDLSRFAALTGLALEGSARVDVAGSGNLASAALSAQVTGRTEDLALGQALADALIGGAGVIEMALARDQDGTRLDDFSLETDELALTADANLTSGASRAEFVLNVREFGLVAPGFQGPLKASGVATADPTEYRADASISGPGIETLRLEGGLSQEDQTIAARLVGGIDAALANSLIAPAEVGGQLDLDLALTGPLDAAELLGTLKLAGDLGLPEPAPSVPEFDVSMTLDGVVRGVTEGGVPGFAGQFEAAVAKLILDDPALSSAVGSALNMGTEIDLEAGQSLSLTGLEVVADHYRMDGEGRLDLAAGQFQADLNVVSENLSRFGPLTGLDLVGAVSAHVSGSGETDGGAAALDLNVSTTDFAIGQPDVDKLLGPSLDLTANATRSGAGAMTADFAFTSEAMTASGVGEVEDGSQSATFLARLSDIGLVADGFSGPLTAEGKADNGPEGATLDATLKGSGVPGLTVEARLAPDFAHLDARADGDVDLSILNGILAPNALEGRLNLAMSMVGPVDNATVEGRLAVADGELRLAEGPVSATNYTLRTDLSGLASNLVRQNGGGAPDPAGVELRIETTVSALELTDPGYANALGSAIETAVDVAFEAGRNLSLNDLSLIAEGFDLAGSLTADLEPEGGDFAADLRIDAQDLTRLAGLAGVPLRGEAGAAAVASGNLDGSGGVLTLNSRTSGLFFGQPSVDRLIGGLGSLDVNLDYDGTSVDIRNFLLETPELSAQADGKVQRGQTDAVFQAGLRDLGVVAPGFDGPFGLEGNVTSEGPTIMASLAGSGPGLSEVKLDGTS